MAAVALVGADGTGKTTVARRVADRLPDARYLYMGVNLEASSIMLPTTRVAVEIKRRLGGRPDMSAPSRRQRSRRRGVLGRLRSELRHGNLIAEEWFRQLVAWYHERRGTLVIFDRHFVWDYHASLSRPGEQGPPGLRGWHDRLLRDRFPRPDLVICLHGPPDLLMARKDGGTVHEREMRQREYLDLGATTRDFVAISVDQPPDSVVDEVIAAITDHFDRRTAR